MRKRTQTLMAAAGLAIGIATATSLYADDSRNTESHGGMMIMSPGMMAPGMMDDGGMMPMMEQMSDMMDHCSQMMQGAEDGRSGVPNEQWRKDAPAAPDSDG